MQLVYIMNGGGDTRHFINTAANTIVHNNILSQLPVATVIFNSGLLPAALELCESYPEGEQRLAQQIVGRILDEEAFSAKATGYRCMANPDRQE